MDLRKEFVLKAIGNPNFRGLCREYGISPKTGYKWRERMKQQGLAGLQEQSRRPKHSATALEEEVVCRIVALKVGHPHWGPYKIRILYQSHYGGKLPSCSSFKRVLQRAGLTVRRRLKRHAESGRLSSAVKALAPNDVWTVDFKGWWRDGQGQRVEPLTVRDEYSRMLLEMRVLQDSTTESVRECFERLFERYGVPKLIRSDNGSPFASANGLLGLSRLSVWWLALGIDLDRNRPGCPQDNGAHERMHRDVRRELESGGIGRDQAAFDLWRDQYNTQRPHEALSMQVPAKVYRHSTRPYKGTPDDIDYGNMVTRRVKRRTGEIRYLRQRIAISTALGGWSVGLKEREDGLVEVYFSKLLLGHIDRRTVSFVPRRLATDQQQSGKSSSCPAPRHPPPGGGATGQRTTASTADNKNGMDQKNNTSKVLDANIKPVLPMS